MNADSALRELVAKWRLLGDDMVTSDICSRTHFVRLHQCATELESILAAPQAAPAGMVLVPRHPKSDVIGAMQRAHSIYAPGSKMERAYAAMCEHFAAAPTAQAAIVRDSDVSALMWLARECDSPEGLGSGVIAKRIRSILSGGNEHTPVPAAPAVVVDEAFIERFGDEIRGIAGEAYESNRKARATRLIAALAAALNQGKANG